tara:strand:+ start:2384 stop:2986 length:603 start_codon:yes stop_codon:yes gene_type:complete
MKIIDIFPTPLGCYELGREFSEEEINFLKNQEWRQMIGNFGSVNTDLLNHKELSKIRLFIEECLKDYLTLTINPIDGNEFYITQSWANVTAPKQHHHGHVHQNSIVSGVLYISAEDGKDGILFTNEDNKYKRIQLDTKEPTSYNSAKFVHVKTGDLLFFPSETEHLVQETISSSERVSLAFNTFVRGDIGLKDSYAELQL